MSQNLYDIEKTQLERIDEAIEASVSLNSGPSEPPTKFAYMLWADTVAGKMKQRNAANTDWIEIWDLPTGVPSQTNAVKNFIIDPDFTQWPQGTSIANATNKYGSVLVKGGTSGTSTVWDAVRSTDVPTYAQSNHHSEFSFQADVTTADATVDAADISRLRYFVTGYDYTFLHEKTVTLSFWVKSPKTGTHCLHFGNDSSRWRIEEYTVDAADTWEKKSITLQLDSSGSWNFDENIGLEVSWILLAGANFQGSAGSWQDSPMKYATSNQVNVCDSTSNNFHLAQVQLEIGSQATPLTAPSIATITEQVDYYFQRLCFNDGSAGVNRGTLMGFFPQTTNGMASVKYRRKVRTIPIVSGSSASTWSVEHSGTDGSPTNNPVYGVISEDSCRQDITGLSNLGTVNAGEAYMMRGAVSTTSYIDIDARH